MGVRLYTTQLSQTPHMWELCTFLNMTFFTIVIAKFWQKRQYNVTVTHQRGGGEVGLIERLESWGELQNLSYQKLQKHTAYTYQKDHDAHLIPINTYK